MTAPVKRPVASGGPGNFLRVHSARGGAFWNPTRLALSDVQIGVRYAIAMSTNAGSLVLFDRRYGRIRAYITLSLKGHWKGGPLHLAFGEHVIGSEVEAAMKVACAQSGAVPVEFTAPQVAPESGPPHHEWFVAFEQTPDDLRAFDNISTGRFLTRTPTTQIRSREKFSARVLFARCQGVRLQFI